MPVRSSAPRRGSGRSATTTSSWSRTARTAKATARHRRGPRSASPSRRSSSCSRPSFPTSPKRCGRGGGSAASTGPPGPRAQPLRAASGAADALPLHVAADVLSEVRRAKSEAKRSMRTPVNVAVTDTRAARALDGRRLRAERHRRARHRGRRLAVASADATCRCQALAASIARGAGVHPRALAGDLARTSRRLIRPQLAEHLELLGGWVFTKTDRDAVGAGPRRPTLRLLEHLARPLRVCQSSSATA